MAAPFNNIGKRITDFFKPKEYNLNRTAKLKVGSDKVHWCLENKLNKNGGIDSELSVAHDFEKETLKLTTSTKKSPQFEVKTKRFSPRFDLTGKVEDPSLELKLKHQKEKYCLNFDTSYNWSSQYCDANLSASYPVNNKLLLGAKLKVERTQKTPFGFSDYNLAAQYKQNDDRTFACKTENRLQKVNVGAEYRRNDVTGFAQISFEFNGGNNGDDDNDNVNANPLSYRVGVQKQISNDANIRALYRNNGTASVMYSSKFPDQGICGKLAANFDLTKPAADRVSLQWKIVFGCVNKSCCK